MPTNTAALQIDLLKAQTAPSELKTGFSIVLFCMIGLVASLVFFNILAAPDVSDIAQLVGP
jgi:hypothetical protein